MKLESVILHLVGLGKVQYADLQTSPFIFTVSRIVLLVMLDASTLLFSFSVQSANELIGAAGK